MIGQIGHLVQVSLRVGLVSAFLYAIGATLSAGAVGLILGTAGIGVHWLFEFEVPPDAALLPVGVLALVGGFRDLGVVSFYLPQPRKQVPREWMRTFGPYKTSLFWGLSIGLVFTTWMEYTLFYVVAFWILMQGSPLVGMAVMALFGLSQGLLLVLDVSVIAAKGDRGGGLLGHARGTYFSHLGGASLLACGAYLLTQWSLLH